jgi:hypothetical protein
MKRRYRIILSCTGGPYCIFIRLTDSGKYGQYYWSDYDGGEWNGPFVRFLPDSHHWVRGM